MALNSYHKTLTSSDTVEAAQCARERNPLTIMKTFLELFTTKTTDICLLVISHGYIIFRQIHKSIIITTTLMPTLHRYHPTVQMATRLRFGGTHPTETT